MKIKSLVSVVAEAVVVGVVEGYKVAAPKMMAITEDDALTLHGFTQYSAAITEAGNKAVSLGFRPDVVADIVAETITSVAITVAADDQDTAWEMAHVVAEKFGEEVGADKVWVDPTDPLLAVQSMAASTYMSAKVFRAWKKVCKEHGTTVLAQTVRYFGSVPSNFDRMVESKMGRMEKTIERISH